MADEPRADADHREVRLELLPRLRVGRVHPDLELHARVAVASRKHPQRPRHLHEALLGETREGLSVVHVHERDVRLPDLADGPDHDLVRRIVGEHLEARLFGAGAQVVDAKLHLLVARQRANREQRPHPRRALTEVCMPQELPGLLRGGRDLHVVHFDELRGGEHPIERGHASSGCTIGTNAKAPQDLHRGARGREGAAIEAQGLRVPSAQDRSSARSTSGNTSAGAWEPAISATWA
jgi:hypothetical protein